MMPRLRPTFLVRLRRRREKRRIARTYGFGSWRDAPTGALEHYAAFLRKRTDRG